MIHAFPNFDHSFYIILWHFYFTEKIPDTFYVFLVFSEIVATRLCEKKL